MLNIIGEETKKNFDEEKMEEIVNKIGNVTKVYANTFEEEARLQVKKMINYEPYLNSKIRIMPDAHSGKGCVIGTTMTLEEAVTPNLVGVDIGCGVLAGYLTVNDIDLKKLDEVIREYVPNGFSVHQSPISYFNLQSLYCYDAIKDKDVYMQQSLGTLGGGNHFIEVNRTSNGEIMIVIHSGSRNLGVQVCNYYQKVAVDTLNNRYDIKAIIEKLKSEGREKEIQSELKKLKSNVVDKELAYLKDQYFEHYIYDMNIVQQYALMNRHLILDTICKNMGLFTSSYIETIHNYIDIGSMILRKGAVRALKGEKLIIPINMRDGSLICIGKGNSDWNYSAPHGAGRLMSREKAKKSISIQDFSNVMSGIYTTSVCEETLDEAPQVYKSMYEIMSLIEDTVEVIDIVKPIYNFKAN